MSASPSVSLSPPFGTYTLPPYREKWRQHARRYNGSWLGRIMISLCRRQAMRYQTPPYDIVLDEAIKLRLYPTDNRCEKHAFSGFHLWENRERQILANTMTESNPAQDFTFVDVGANIGLYALSVYALAKKHNRTTNIVAIEPSRIIHERLKVNVEANAAPIRLMQAAISDHSGKGYLGGSSQNHGQAHLQSESEHTEPVCLKTLADICQTHKLTHINVLKIDIEGHEYRALNSFFHLVPAQLHPCLIIVEALHSESARPLIELCQHHSYIIRDTTRWNIIFIKNTHV